MYRCFSLTLKPKKVAPTKNNRSVTQQCINVVNWFGYSGIIAKTTNEKHRYNANVI